MEKPSKKMYTVLIEAYHENNKKKYLMTFIACAESKHTANVAVQHEHDFSGVTILSVVVNERTVGNQTAFLKAQEII